MHAKELLLCMSAKTSECDITEMLIKQGANVNYVDNKKKFPLYHAYENNMIEQMKILLSHGAHIDQTIDDDTILCKECTKPNPDIIMVKFLMDNCANPNFKALYPILIQLAINKKEDCALLLLSYSITDVDIIDYNLVSVLRYACMNNLNSLAIQLLQKGADPNIKGYDGRWPLSRCIDEQKFEMASILISRNNIDLNLQDDNGNTVLHKACSDTSEYLCIVYQLLYHGADRTIKNNNGEIAFDRCTDSMKWIFEACSQSNIKKSPVAQEVIETPVYRLPDGTIGEIKHGFVGNFYQTWNEIFDCWGEWKDVPCDSKIKICEYIDEKKVSHHIVNGKDIKVRFNCIRRKDGSIMGDLYDQ